MEASRRLERKAMLHGDLTREWDFIWNLGDDGETRMGGEGKRGVIGRKRDNAV